MVDLPRDSRLDKETGIELRRHDRRRVLSASGWHRRGTAGFEAKGAWQNAPQSPLVMLLRRDPE